jgi:GntR family transcriptional regulator / MocR family aminotransferase
MGPFIALQLDRRSRVPLQRQLYDEIRTAILSGRLAPGARVPATRVLASDTGTSRNTVSGAFDQLLSEGYLEGKVGSGTYVARMLPEDLLRVTRQPGPSRPVIARACLSRRGRMLGGIPASLRSREIATEQAFRTGLPAFDEFPRALWARLGARLLRHAPSAVLTYGDPAGYRPLRRAIAEYLRAARGVNCSAEQVIVTAGSQQALDLAARLLLDPGDAAWVEDPGYLGARGALRAAGVRSIPVPVDSGGLSVVEGEKRAPEARLACVTPSHQYPLGMTMPLSRRTSLLAWARRHRAWIVEDDYDSEFRYSGRPLQALQGLDPIGCVIYTGTFSKVLFPSLRLGYMVMPESLLDTFVSARALVDRHPPGLEQAIVAEFLAEGHFARHVRRMRTLYAERQEALVLALGRELGGAIEASPAEAGMNLTAWLRGNASDLELSNKAAQVGVVVTPVSAYALEVKPRSGLLLGYAAFTTRQIREGVRKLAQIF